MNPFCRAALWGALALSLWVGAQADAASAPVGLTQPPPELPGPARQPSPPATAPLAAAKAVEIQGIRTTPERACSTRPLTVKVQVRNPNDYPLLNLRWRVEDAERHALLYEHGASLFAGEQGELATSSLNGLGVGGHILRLVVVGDAGFPEAQREFPVQVQPPPATARLVGMGIIAAPEGGGGEHVLDLTTTGVPAGGAATLFLDFDHAIATPLVVDLASTWPGFPVPSHFHVAPSTAGNGVNNPKQHGGEACPPHRVLFPLEVGGLFPGARFQAVVVTASLGREARKIEFLAVSRCPNGQVRLLLDQCGAPGKTPVPAAQASAAPSRQGEPGPAASSATMLAFAPGTLPSAPATPSLSGEGLREALAFCWQNKAQTWYCDGKNQEASLVGEKDMMVQLANVGCKSPHLLSGTMTILASTRVPGRGQQIGWLFGCGQKLDKADSGHATSNRDIRRFWSGIPW